MNAASVKLFRAPRPTLAALAGDSLLVLLAIVIGIAVLLGTAFCLAGFGKAVLTVPHFLLAAGFAMEAAVWYATWLLFRGKTTYSDGRFALLIAALWVITRCAVIFAFPNAALMGDETFLHRFVVALANGGLGRANLSTLSSWYDYPVWLSRAFPFYLPLRLLFGSADLLAVRFLNAALGAGTVVLAFFISRRLIGSAYARLAAWILLIWPYHVANVLSYDPQIPGTFFFLLGIWLALDLVYSSALQISWKTAIRAILLGLDLWLAEVQRGGIDALLFVSIIVSACLYSLMRTSPYNRAVRWRAFAGLLALTFVSWMPPRIAFERWIEGNDTQHLRSHLLGFMTRGWNLASMGEYLPRYEELDVSSPTAEKNRILESVLATEFVRRPLDTLTLLPATKMAKFLALGYSASAETDLEEGGYPRAAMVLKALRVTSALLLLVLCGCGLTRILQHTRFRTRLVLPLVLTALSIIAITLIWETMSRYSHPLHFALAMLAAIGFLSLRKKTLVRSAMHVWLNKRIAISVAVIAVAWILCWSAAFAAGSMATSYRFPDLRRLRADVDGTSVSVVPLNGRTAAWEDAIEIPSTTALPADLHLLLPASAIPLESSRFSLSMWIPDEDRNECPSCEIQINGPGIQPAILSFKNLLHMTRLTVTATPLNDGSRTIQLRLLGPHTRTGVSATPLSLAIGYFLPE